VESCPACGRPTRAGALECDNCHLAAALFDPVREAVGVPRSDPGYVQELSEVLAALEAALPVPATEGSSRGGEISYSARWLATPSPRASSPPSSAARPRMTSGLPALPGGHGPALWRRQIDEYLRLGRQRGIDLANFASDARAAIQADDAASLEVLNRDLFVFVAAKLTEELELAHRRREELRRWAPVTSIDSELESAEQALALGDLPGVDRRLRRIQDEITHLEEDWEAIQILLTEADLMRETIVELSGDPGPAMGPLEKGRKLSESGHRTEAESMLVHANTALWSVLAPLLARDLRRLKDVVLRQQAEGADVTDAALELREIATHLRHHNFGAMVAGYRRLRTLADSWPAATGDGAMTLASPGGAARSS
jgi:hypothetical protein